MQAVLQILVRASMKILQVSHLSSECELVQAGIVVALEMPLKSSY